jgi:DNA polymerase-3 subunit epsilon
MFERGYRPVGMKKFQHSNLKDLVAQTDEFSPDHPFFNKNVVFTGTLKSMVRKEAAQLVVNAGGRCSNSVNRETNFLVIGDLDFRKLKDGTKSNKIKKAEELIEAGYDLEILSEKDFLELL